MHWLSVCLSVLCLFSLLQVSYQQTCRNACSDEGVPEEEWASQLGFFNPTAMSVMLTWTMDDTVLSPSYVVEFRISDSSDQFTQAPGGPITGTSFTLEGLDPNTEYSVQVCRPNTTTVVSDECGHCRLCATTTPAEAPPSPPREVTIMTLRSEFLIISWVMPTEENVGGVTSYTITCTAPGQPTQNLTESAARESPQTLTVRGLTPDTLYSCSVVATNQFGPSAPASVNVTTLPSIDAPGALLVYFSGSLSFVPWTAETGAGNNLLPLLSIPTTDTVRGIDFDYHRDAVYFSSRDASETSTIKRLSVTRAGGISGGVTLSTDGTPVTLFTADTGREFTHISVDWVSDEMYYVEVDGGTSRIYRRSLIAVSTPYCVGEASVPITKIEADPVHGFFYWSTNTTLFSVLFSDVQTTSSQCQANFQATSEQKFTSVGELRTFVIEQEVAITFSGNTTCLDNSMEVRTEAAIQSLALDGSGISSFIGSFPLRDTIASFGRSIIVPVFEDVRLLRSAVLCGQLVATTDEVTTPNGANVELMKMYRISQQPLPTPPGPPRNIRIVTTDVNATLTWEPPLFAGTFFSADANADWTYMLRICAVGVAQQDCMEANTTSLTFTAGLDSNRSYSALITAIGQGGSQTIPKQLIFTMKNPDFNDAVLLIANQEDVQRSTLNGDNARDIERDFSFQSNAVARDPYTDSQYWLTEGGQAFLYGQSGSGNVSVIYRRRSSPFALEYDWITKRLFWAENGNRPNAPQFVGFPDDPKDTPDTVNTLDRVQSTALDARNGLLFWTDLSYIRMLTLSGVDLGVCHEPPEQASSLAVDVARKQLYWLSGFSSESERLTVSQMEYDSLGCNPSSIAMQELSDATFTSSSTMLEYGSNTLFISNRGSNSIYTMSSDLASVTNPDEQTLAISTLRFTGTASALVDIRDIAASSRSLQPLPESIPLFQRGLDILRPGAPASSPRRGDSVTPRNITIEWDPARDNITIPGTTFSYRLNYTLTRPSGEVINGSVVTQTNSYTLTEQVGSTAVTATVSTLSNWAESFGFASGSFVSLPDIPDAVENVRVFLFRPNRDRSVITGLVFWNRMNAQNYTVQLFEEGNSTSLPNLFAPNFPKTSYVIFQKSPRGLVVPNGLVTYPIQLGETYEVTVSATNMAGSGPPSQPVTFTAEDSQFFPEQILARTVNGSAFFGDGLDINQPLSVSGGGPIVVDAIERNVFWYYRSAETATNIIYSQSLHSGDQDPFLLIPPEKVIAALAFDWVGDELYMVRVNEGATSPSRLEIFSVSVFNREVVNNVFPNLTELVDSGSSFQLVMNPFTGFLYMTETTPTGTTTLKAFNLRNRDLRGGNTLFTSSQTRRRRRRSSRIASSRLRRQTSLDLVPSLTSALAQDPFTGELLLCNEGTGDILRCNVSITPPSCSVEVMRDALEDATPGRVVGLPADNIAINEDRLYWSNADGIFSVSRSSIGSEAVTVVSNSAQSAQIVSPNPGLQLISANQNCLSPTFGTVMERPDIRMNDFIVTNTTIKMFWDLNASPVCDEEFFSVPPYTFVAIHELSMQGPRFDFFTYAQFYLFENLEPFSSNFLSVLVSNEFTIYTVPGFESARTQVRRITLEGVPNQAENFVANVMGTSSVRLSWDAVSGPENLRGENAIYFLVFENGEVNTTLTTHTLTNSDLLIPGAQQVVQLIVGNDVLNSTPSSLTVTLWSLVLAPERVDGTNTTLNLSITIPNDGRFDFVQSVNFMYCLRTRASVFSEGCSCPMDTGRRITEDFSPVETPLPFSAMFNVGNLMPNTEYCVQSIGNYGAETTPGEGRIVITDSGVPDAPNATREDGSNVLMWSMPSGNGEPITQYIIIATTRSNTDPIESPPLFPEVTEFNLDNLVDGTLIYEVVVRASNRVGQGPPSNMVSYQRQETGFVLGNLTIPEIVGIVLAAVSITAIISVILVIICFLQCRTSKRDIRSLSYMYGPDHELSNLRDAYRNAQSSNPHYTWSREDYVCTDEDLNLLNKFPRTNLKLETFIDRGEFGEVFQGTAHDILGPATGPTPVAIKTLRKGSTLEEQQKFLSEAALQANFNHPNIVKVLGVCVDNDPVYIIMELMPGGDLLKFLREAKMDHGPTLLTVVEQIQVAVDVAHGCNYLEQQHFIHRDIAARNCLVSSRGSDRVVKIGDFGLAKDLYSSDYYQVEGQRKLPVRWMAPEALLQGKFTTESDIWSYGVLLWEIMTLGNQPYPGRINQEVLQFVTGGGRLDRPEKCPSKIYHLMQNCWKRYASERPHFEEILNILTNFMDRLKRPDSVYYSDSDSEDEPETNHVAQRQGSGKLPSRTPSIREGIINLARSGSIKFRNSFRRHNSTKREERVANNSQEDGGSNFRERGPF